MKKIPITLLFLISAVQLPAADVLKDKPAILWRHPSDIRSRNLFYGPGGKAHVPQGPFVFVKEDTGGSSPKFVVTDKSGARWKVKLGVEARSETATSRLVWAVGYETDEDYFVPELDVREMPHKLHRGQKLLGPNGSVRDACLELADANGKKLGSWKWRQNEFSGARELNGLRVLMAVINNWDLKDGNTAIYEGSGRPIFAVSDLGATLGSPARTWPADKSKNNIENYSKSKFVRKVTADTVDFQNPGRSSLIYLVNPKEYIVRLRMQWIGRSIPRNDVRWMATLLSRLSPSQIRDAFRAAGYAPDQVEAFARVIEGRIAVLKNL